MNTLPIAAARQVLPVRSSAQRLVLLLILLWALMFGLSSGPGIRAAEPPAGGTSEVALLTPVRSRARLSRPAPELQVSTWIDQSGPVTAPQIDGKVQLVVFWGLNCPACVRKVPQVRKAASRFVDTDLVVIGLHNAQISEERVARFVRERQLNFPVAIDRSGRNRYSFGRTSAAYQVQAIPHAAVIDRDGSLRYVGDFDEALEAAEKLVDVSAG